MSAEILSPSSVSQVGATIGLGCQNCELRDSCGGVFSDHDCMGACYGCDPGSCTMACPRSKNWVTVLRDAGGFALGARWMINQTSAGMPLYIPHIANGSGRSECLEIPFSAVTTFDVVRALSSGLISNGDDLRRHFRLHHASEVISLSIEKDRHLERFWRYFREREYASRLSAVGIRHITAPNFSFALDVPRPEHLVNRTRSLRCAEELSTAGMSVIVHLNAYNQTDWDSWRDFLKDHSSISIVSLEFQTGLATARKARWHISQVRQLQQSLGRPLHLLAAGGRRHLHMLAEFSGLTIVDSVPFIRTTKRRRLEIADGKWRFVKTAHGESLHTLLQHNVTAYSELVRASLERLRSPQTVAPKFPVGSVPDPRQLTLGFWAEPSKLSA